MKTMQNLLIILIILFIAFSFLNIPTSMAQTIKFTPSATPPTGWELPKTGTKPVFNPSTKSMDNGPIYVTPTLLAPKSFILELVIGWTGAIPNATLATKPGGFSISTRNGKLLHGWTKANLDEYNMSELEVAGITTLRPNTRYAVRYEYDAITGQVLVKLNGFTEIQFYRIWPPSDLSWNSEKLQLLVGQTGIKLYGATLSSNRPVVSPMITVVANGFVHFERLAPSALNTPTRIEVRDPFDGLVEVKEIRLTGEIKVAYKLSDLNGIHTVTITTPKCSYSRTVCVPKGPVVNMPEFSKGFYNVRADEFSSPVGINMAASDWVMNREPGGSSNLSSYLVKAGAAGIKLSIVGNYNAARTRPFAEPTANVHSYLVGDEVGGYFDRFVVNYNAIRVWSTVPVAMSLNNFTSIYKAAEACDFMYLNIYNCKGNVEKIIDLVRIASKYRPVIVVLPSYSNEQNDVDVLRAQIQVAIDAGAIGAVIFEWSHGGEWHIPTDKPGVINVFGE